MGTNCRDWDENEFYGVLLGAARVKVIEYRFNTPWTIFPLVLLLGLMVFGFLVYHGVIDILLIGASADQLAVASRSELGKLVVDTQVFLGLGSIIIPLIAISLVIRHSATMRRIADSIDESIRISGIVEQLKADPEWIREIYLWTPGVFTALLGPRPKSMRGYAKLLAANISWFIREKVRYIKVEWLGMMCFWLILTSSLVSVLFHRWFPVPVLVLDLLLVLLVAVLAVYVNFQRNIHRLLLLSLCKQIEERYGPWPFEEEIA